MSLLKQKEMGEAKHMSEKVVGRKVPHRGLESVWISKYSKQDELVFRINEIISRLVQQG